MTNSDFRKWIDSQGISDAEAARRLGCSKNSVTSWLYGRTAIPVYIALAVAALQRGLQPWPN